MKQSKTAIVSAVFFMVLCVVGGIILYHNRAETIIALKHAKWYYLLIAAAFALLSYLFASFSFDYTLRLFSAKVPMREKLRIGFITTAVNNVTGLGGTVAHSLRATMLKPFEIPATKSVAISVIDSYFNQMVFFGFFPVGLAYLIIRTVIPQLNAFLISILILAFLLGASLFSVSVFNGRFRRALIKLFDRFTLRIFKKNMSDSLWQFDAALSYGIAQARKKQGDLALLIIYDIADWVTSLASLAFCFLAVGALVNPIETVAGFAVSTTAGAVSLIPGGLGAQDLSMVAIFHLMFIPFQKVILAIISFRLVYYLIPYVLSMFFYGHFLGKNHAASDAQRHK